MDGRAPGDEVDGDRPGLDPVAQGRRGSPEHRPDPGQQLVVVERPRHVVITAAVEGADPVDGVGLGPAEHDHRHLAVPRAPGLALAESAAELG